MLIATLTLGVGIIIGYFGINKGSSSPSPSPPSPWPYENLTREADPKNYQTYIDSVQAANIEGNLKYTYYGFDFYQIQSVTSFPFRNLTSVPHLAGLPEDLDSANVIEQRWKEDGLDVYKPKYNALFSYPDENNPNRFESIFCTSTSIFLSSIIV